MSQNLVKNKYQMVFDDSLYNLSQEIISVTLPSISLSTEEKRTPLGGKFFESGENIDYSPLSIQFVVGSDMSNYINLIDWVYELYNPMELTISDKEIQGSLLVYDVSGNLRRTFDFQNLRPTDISEIEFASNDTDNNYEVCTVSFVFDHMRVYK